MHISSIFVDHLLGQSFYLSPTGNIKKFQEEPNQQGVLNTRGKKKLRFLTNWNWQFFSETVEDKIMITIVVTVDD